MLPRTILAGAVAAGALAVPTVASAGTLNVPGTCFDQGSFFRITGSGFTPLYRSEVVESHDPSRSFGLYPEADGTFDVEFKAPEYALFTPRTITVTVNDQVNPANSASASYQEVRYGSNLPVAGKPTSTVRWQFAGFPAGKPIYGHFRLGNRTWRDHRFGTASGPCGLLTARAKRLPLTTTQLRSPRRLKGNWYVQVDTNPRFSENTRPRYYKYWTVK